MSTQTAAARLERRGKWTHCSICRREIIGDRPRVCVLCMTTEEKLAAAGEWSTIAEEYWP